MRQKSIILTALAIGILILSLASQVKSTGIATGGYKLDTPLPLATYYVGKYSNGSFFAVNGSNWDNFIVSTNATYVLANVIGNCTDGQRIFIQGGVSYGLTTIYTDTYAEVRTSSDTLVEGQVVCFDTSTFTVTLAKANAVATMGLGYVYLNLWNASAPARTIVAENTYIANSAWAWTPNDILYISPITAGSLTPTIPNVITHVTMQVGTAITATIIKFQNLMTPIEIKQGVVQIASYTINLLSGTYYVWFGDNSTLAFTTDNKLYACQQANDNLTSGGMVILKDFDKPSGLSIGANVTFLALYDGNMKYYTSTASGKVGNSPVCTNGTYAHPSGTTEQTILTITPAGVMELYNFYFDVTTLTHNATIRVYSKIDGSTWTLLTDMSKTAQATDAGLVLKGIWVNTDLKITIESDFAEGTTRNIPYRYFTEEW